MHTAKLDSKPRYIAAELYIYTSVLDRSTPFEQAYLSRWSPGFSVQEQCGIDDEQHFLPACRVQYFLILFDIRSA